MLRESGTELGFFTTAIADSICAYLGSRLRGLGVTGARLDRDVVHDWLRRSSTGPFNDEFADYVLGITHVAGGTTFPGLTVALPPQMVVGLIARLQGEILVHLGDVGDTITLSGVGGIWMDQLTLQLGIMLEPVLGSPRDPRDVRGGPGGDFHPYAALAGFGAAAARTLVESGAMIAPAASGVLSLASTYLLGRPESSAYAEDPQLTIAVMGWAQLRLMTALNTISFEPPGASNFGELGDAGVLADVGVAWMRMLTLQLGVLIDPYLKDPP
jgi:hypothetical protein